MIKDIKDMGTEEIKFEGWQYEQCENDDYEEVDDNFRYASDEDYFRAHSSWF